MAFTQPVVTLVVAVLGSCTHQVPRGQLTRLDQVSLDDLDVILAAFAHDVGGALLLRFLFSLRSGLLHGL